MAKRASGVLETDDRCSPKAVVSGACTPTLAYAAREGAMRSLGWATSGTPAKVGSTPAFLFARNCRWPRRCDRVPVIAVLFDRCRWAAFTPREWISRHDPIPPEGEP